MAKLSEAVFGNSFTDHFPGIRHNDPRPRQTPDVLYSRADPTPVSKPELLAWSDDLAETLGLDNPDSEDLQILAGNKLNSSMFPYAARYAGHQFGNWAGQLGDGRAITMGELTAPDGNTWELQWKGAGPTPYSRRADGRAVLRSSLREYLMSEAMYHLGVPTTRALSLVGTGDKVMRDMFYDGHPEYEPGAIVTRVSPSFLRFGNFEMLAARGEIENLKNLTEWTIQKFYPQLSGTDAVLKLLETVLDRTAFLMIEWMRVGFVHGVMNTDNMSILGLTIDYGPFSFVDDYDPNFTPNTTDLPGRRYAFGRQPSIGYWNLGCLAGALAPLVGEEAPLVAVLDTYQDILLKYYHKMMTGKLGLDAYRTGDNALMATFEETLATLKPDMTIFYQLLITVPMDGDDQELLDHFSGSFYAEPDELGKEKLLMLLQKYRERRRANTISNEEAEEKMRKHNPRFIARNYLLHQAIEELERGDASLFETLQQAIREPYSDRFDQFFKRRPDWAGNKAGCSMLSCSS